MSDDSRNPFLDLQIRFTALEYLFRFLLARELMRADDREAIAAHLDAEIDTVFGKSDPDPTLHDHPLVEQIRLQARDLLGQALAAARHARG